jgi:hypothetical protein
MKVRRLPRRRGRLPVPLDTFTGAEVVPDAAHRRRRTVARVTYHMALQVQQTK